MNKTMKEPRHPARAKFDETFKREAVQNWLSSSKSATQIGDELGIRPALLYQWKKDYAPAAANDLRSRTVPELEAQLAESQREIHQLRDQRDILKKTLGILSVPPPIVTSALKR